MSTQNVNVVFKPTLNLRSAIDRAMRETIFGTGPRRSPMFIDFESSPFHRGGAINLGAGSLMATPIIPAFVEPERPAEPEAPKPEPDSPAVTMLRSLLADRQEVLSDYEDQIKASLSAIKDTEQELAEMRADLEHEKTCAAAAQAEVDAVKADIVKLGGVIEDDEA